MAKADRLRCELRMPNMAAFADQVRANAVTPRQMATPDSRVGRTLTIAGAGPSLRNAILPATDEVWAVNSALPWLMDQGARVTHGVTIDQGAAMLGPAEWGRVFPVTYLVASSAHPDLVRHLEAAGRPVVLFHSYLGLPDAEDEVGLYRTLYPTSILVGHGLNGVPRAVCLALGMGFDHITVVGADCAAQPDGADPMPAPGTADYADWLGGVVLYADGRTAAIYGDDAPMAEGVINGRRWVTRPDMIVSAMHLLELEAAYPGRVSLVGDTLPNAFRGQDADWWSGLPTLSPEGAVENFGRMEAVA